MQGYVLWSVVVGGGGSDSGSGGGLFVQLIKTSHHIIKSISIWIKLIDLES